MLGYEKLADIADTQLGLIAWTQARDVGISARQLRHLVATAFLHRVHDGVFRVRGAAESYDQALLAACLAVGPEAAASHRAAATKHGLLSYRRPPVELTTTRMRSPERHGVVVHRLSDLDARWVQRSGAVPVTTVARTLVDLGAVVSPRTVEAALDRAAGRRLVTYRDVRDALLAVARKGRRGVGAIRPLLEARIGQALPVGVLAAGMSSVLRRAGMSDAVTEYTITDDHGGFIAVADFAYPDHRVAVEVDGFEFHSSPKAVDMGNARDRLLLGAGWIVLHFSWTDVEHRPHRVADEIRHILNVRHAG